MLAFALSIPLAKMKFLLPILLAGTTAYASALPEAQAGRGTLTTCTKNDMSNDQSAPQGHCRTWAYLGGPEQSDFRVSCRQVDESDL